MTPPLHIAKSLALLALPFLLCALVGADLGDRTVARYTVVIAEGKGRCSGVVMAQDIVMTAAHCVEDGSKLLIGALLNDGDRVPTELSAVTEAVKHPLYRSNDAGSPDLAILKLARPLPDRFTPATLNPRGLALGDDLMAAGYGKSASNDKKAGIVLRMVVLRVADGIRGWVTLVSAREDASGGAPGDSGGPVFSYRGMYSLVGIIVGISGNRTKAVALAAHYGWIRETMEKMGAK